MYSRICVLLNVRMWLILLFVALALAAIHRPTTTKKITHMPTQDPKTLYDECDGIRFSRAQAIGCLLDVVDVNPRDGRITPGEIELFKNNYLSWFEKTLAEAGSLLGVGTIEVIMRDCDGNGDGAIDYSDMIITEDRLVCNLILIFC